MAFPGNNTPDYERMAHAILEGKEVIAKQNGKPVRIFAKDGNLHIEEIKDWELDL